MNTYGWQGADAPARVTAVHRDRYTLICPQGQVFARLKTGVYYGRGEEFPTVGDFVRIQYEPVGDSLILQTLPRHSFFSRRNPTKGQGEQAIAANFDTVFVMSSLNHDLNPARLERYLTLAWQSGATPVVILTKADLVDDYTAQLHNVQNIAIGVDIVAVSARTGQGLELLAPYLQPRRTVVFLGSSGVGKSSLINALAGETLMDVQAIREDDSRGRHTTTHRQLFMLPGGAMVIDTPGMRELGMWDVSSGLGDAFADVEEVLTRPCKFGDCAHQSEPGCAIKAAIAGGELPEARWRTYCTLQQEAEYTENRGQFLRDKKQWHKSIAKWSKKMKQSGEIRK